MKKLLSSIACAMALSTAANAATIDIAVLYTDPAANKVSSISTKINQLISHTNRVYRNNAIDAQVRLVGSARASSSDLQPTESALRSITNSQGVQNYRASTGADMVVLLGTAQPVGRGIVCGIGWVGQGSNGTLAPQSRDIMYSITAVDCGANTFVHELGHNMGLGHSVRQGSLGGVYPWGVGHGVDNNFSTIMAYPQSFGRATQLDYFSDPYWDGCNNLPCGVPNESDAYRATQAVVDQIAAYN